jgi:HAD superfamily hydrolase (TIGR01509 family)
VNAAMAEEIMLMAVLWDMDGTLIDSEPYWHESELRLARAHGGQWNDELAWQGSGKPVPQIARQMVALGTDLSETQIGEAMIDYVARSEMRHMPWIPGVEKVLKTLTAAGIPSVLVTTSPRALAQNLVDQAPRGAFVGFVCGDDDVAKKPDPAPYLAAGRIVGIGEEQMRECIAVEDSLTGLQSAVSSGATTLAQTAYIRTDTSQGPQFASISGYEGLTVRRLEEYVRQRIGI